ncbi:MAG: hypothetical protein OHK0017_05790 [Patescibacteria group bacterium]
MSTVENSHRVKRLKPIYSSESEKTNQGKDIEENAHKRRTEARQSNYEIVVNSYEYCRQLGLKDPLLKELKSLISRLTPLGQWVLNQKPDQSQTFEMEGRGYYLDTVKLSAKTKGIVYIKGAGGSNYFSNEGHPDFKSFPDGEEFSDIFYDAAGTTNPRISGMVSLQDAKKELINNCVIFTNLAKKYKWTSLDQAVAARVSIPLFTATYPKISQFYSQKIDFLIKQIKSELNAVGHQLPEETQLKSHLKLNRLLDNLKPDLTSEINLKIKNWLNELYSLITIEDRDFGVVLSASPSKRRIGQYVTDQQNLEYKHIERGLNSRLNAESMGLTLRNMLEIGAIHMLESLHGQNRYDLTSVDSSNYQVSPSIFAAADFADISYLEQYYISPSSIFNFKAGSSSASGQKWMIFNMLNADLQYIPETVPNNAVNLTFDTVKDIQESFWKSLLSGIATEKSVSQIPFLLPLLRPEVNFAAALLLYDKCHGQSWKNNSNKSISLLKSSGIEPNLPSINSVSSFQHLGNKLSELVSGKLSYIEDLMTYLKTGNQTDFESCNIIRLSKSILEGLQTLEDKQEQTNIIRLLSESFQLHDLANLREDHSFSFDYFLSQERLNLFSMLAQAVNKKDWNTVRYIGYTVNNCRTFEQLFYIPNTDGSNRAKEYIRKIQSKGFDLELIYQQSNLDTLIHTLLPQETKVGSLELERSVNSFLVKVIDWAEQNPDQINAHLKEVDKSIISLLYGINNHKLYEPTQNIREKLNYVISSDKELLKQVIDFIHNFLEFKSELNSENWKNKTIQFKSLISKSPLKLNQEPDLIKYIITASYLTDVIQFVSVEDINTLLPLVTELMEYLIDRGTNSDKIKDLLKTT